MRKTLDLADIIPGADYCAGLGLDACATTVEAADVVTIRVRAPVASDRTRLAMLIMRRLIPFGARFTTGAIATGPIHIHDDLDAGGRRIEIREIGNEGAAS